MPHDNYLVWIDLEMTGLDPQNDTILEIASIVTDNNLTIIEKGPQLVIQHTESEIASMNDWCKTQHKKTGLSDEALTSPYTLLEAEKLTIDFLKLHCFARTAPLCGNSVYHDKTFLFLYMPTLYSFLHYRIIDVSSVKEVVRRWYPQQTTFFKKKDIHRALPDIEESIEELKFYQTNFFINKT